MDDLESAVSNHEAHNIDRLGNYAFAYGLFALTGCTGLFAVSVVLHVPQHGPFGAVQVLRYTLRFLSAITMVFACYALYCRCNCCGKTSVRSSLKLSSVAVVFAALSIEFGDLSSLLLNVLRQLESSYSLSL